MVMEIPTPQCVGREFVRQYYTLLNKAPLHLHRFYNQDSSFLHGGLDRPGQETKPVVGQQDIHERIMQLNFRDCHAKIRQVDSLETLGDGVVVQVSGELSNNGQPMRRFMQTFVLAPQSPKKYYVRNDIFRYQDEIFTEDEDGEMDNALADIDTEEASNPKDSVRDEDPVGYHENEIVRNGVYPQPAPASPPPELEAESTKSDWEEDDEELEEEEIPVAEEAPESPPAQGPAPFSAEPKTYANMVSKNTVLPATSPVFKTEPVPYKPEPPSQVVREKTETNAGRSPEERKPVFMYPDSQQLFVGNLTHSITEEDLKSHFNQFGKVLDMRINTKQTQKVGGGKVPNFGFIVFEQPESVQKVLGSRPIYFNEHRLNVEEKKRPKTGLLGDSRVGPPRSGLSPRVGVGSRGPRQGMMGRGDNRMRGSYAPRR